MSSAPPDFLLEEFLPYRLSVTANRVSRLFASRYGAEFGLSIPEWRVMAVLGRFGALPAREIAQQTAMDKVKVSRAAGLLLARKLVRRRADRADARLQWVGLTAGGARMHAAILPLARALEEELLAALTPDQVATLHDALSRIGEKLGSQEDLD